MKKTIYKYPLVMTTSQSIYLPIGAKILTAQLQNGILCLWALIDPEQSNQKKRCFEILGTGDVVCYDQGVTREYITTVQQGMFVFHLFECTDV